MSTIGTIELIAKIDTSQYKKGTDEIEKSNEEISKSAEQTESAGTKAMSRLATFGLAAVASAAVAAGAAIVRNIGGAVRRVDTLNNFPKVMTNLGYGADEAERAIDALDKGVRGLPTSLDQIASSMQNIAPSTKSLSEATRLALALNNALIAGGKPAALQASAMEQFSQAIAKGVPDLVEWRSLQTAMPGQLDQVAQRLGFGRGEWQKMAQAVTDGVIPLSDVTDAIIELNEKGLAEFPSFADQAKNAAGGLETGFGNFQTAITRGIAKVINAIGSDNISKAASNLGKAFESALKSVESTVNFIKNNKEAFTALAFAIGGVTTAVIAYNTYIKVSAALTTAYSAAITYFTLVTSFMSQGLGVARAAMLALNVAFGLSPVGLLVIAISALVGVLIYFFTQTEVGQKIFSKAFGVIKNVITGIFEWVKNNWPLLLGILLGPFGLAVVGIIKNFDKIKEVAGTVWNWIKGAFGTIGELASGIVRGAVNAVLGHAERTINGFIRIINGVLGAINKLPGVNIGKIGELNIPKLADGGIVSSATLAVIGEGREPEAVIPLSKLDQMLQGGAPGESSRDTYNITIEVSGTFATSRTEQRKIAEIIAQRLQEVQRSKAMGGGIA